MSKETIKQYFILCSTKFRPKIHPLNETKKKIVNADILFAHRTDHLIVKENIIGGVEHKIICFD